MNQYILETFHRLVKELNVTTKRYLYPKFNLKDRLTGLIGPRGVGKTTLLLQYIKNELYKDGKVFYFTADLMYFDSMSLLEFVADLYSNGGYRIVFIDEIHKYPNWNQELKNLYDSFPSLRIVFSGSSMLDLIKGSYDLSRRATLFYLRGMSFREFLNFNHNLSLSAMSWEKLFDSSSQPLLSVENLPHLFQNFLEVGYYPFVAENPLSYYEKLTRVIDKTIYEDIANYYQLKTPNLQYFKKILLYLSSIPPGEINTHNLGKHLGIDHKTATHYLQILNNVGMVRMVYPKGEGASIIRKPSKIFLHNTTLLHAVSQVSGSSVSKGMERELFFFQSLMDAEIDVFYSKNGDFLAKDTIFEVGGKNKTSQQIKNLEKPAYLVKDGIRIAHGKQLPLYNFGFLY
jgi:predicted AAA+ superfamily ATPase